eukprot:11298651-Alexandrium_andersonii.AAC.1
MKQPDPRGLRQGDTFDACVSLLYKFVGRRFRTVVVNNVREYSRLLRSEEAAFETLLSSGLLDES